MLWHYLNNLRLTIISAVKQQRLALVAWVTSVRCSSDLRVCCPSKNALRMYVYLLTYQILLSANIYHCTQNRMNLIKQKPRCLIVFVIDIKFILCFFSVVVFPDTHTRARARAHTHTHTHTHKHTHTHTHTHTQVRDGKGGWGV